MDFACNGSAELNCYLNKQPFSPGLRTCYADRKNVIQERK